MSLEAFQSVEKLIAEEKKLLEVELMLTPKELQVFAQYCIENDVKFNDWIRKLAYDFLEKKSIKDTLVA